MTVELVHNINITDKYYPLGSVLGPTRPKAPRQWQWKQLTVSPTAITPHISAQISIIDSKIQISIKIQITSIDQH